ncbi:MAG: hypothetical protein ACRD5H_00105 [Nitrososphaerales archaeon]
MADIVKLLEFKPWWMSKTIIGAVIAGVSGSLGLVLDETAILSIIDNAGVVFGAALAIYGRVVAKKVIK